ncbi:endonuclease NucS domain-containing protein [Nodosilinea sp. AN01ver1]|uniref:endonuclease NucS domain-containing protein n=1 Tax=Nodosilinea sp. AN01ver1 TaxID=3423362 RepID=UPI003D31A0DD
MQSNLIGVTLRRIAEGWEFSSELALENFIWNHLDEVLGLTPLQRQYIIRGEICDILAISSQRQLVILELKNAEDRYVVHQLTRYYDGLFEEKPFSQEVDYGQPIRLIAIAPTFHRHNFIDRKYNKLPIEFIKSVVQQESDKFQLILEHLDTQDTCQIQLPYQELKLEASIPGEKELPEVLERWLGSCTPQKQEGFRRVRSQILDFHERMKEFVGRRTIQYGTGKTKLCAEFCFDLKNQVPILFLWLPLPTSRTGSTIGRLRIWTDGISVSNVGHVPDGLGKMRLSEEWDQIPKEKWPRNYLVSSISHKSDTPISTQGYLSFTKVGYESDSMLNLEGFVEIALQKWLKKL